MKEASKYMYHKLHHGIPPNDENPSTWEGDVWDMDQVENYARDCPGRCIVLINGFVVDVTGYLGEHVSCSGVFILFTR